MAHRQGLTNSNVSTPSIASQSNCQARTFKITHPFHPLHGKTFTLLDCRHRYGEYRACYRDKKGNLSSFPARWTSAVPVEPFVLVSNGRSPFRITDLLELSRLLKAISPEEGGSEGEEV